MSFFFFFFFKQKTAYEMRISDWSSDVCSSDLCEEQVADLYLSGLRASVAKNDVEFVIRAHIPVKGQLGCQGFQISLDRFGGRACRPGGTIETGTHRAANAERRIVPGNGNFLQPQRAVHAVH